MRAARFLVFALLFISASVPIYLGTAVAELASPGAIHHGARLWSRVFIGLGRAVLGIRLTVRGQVPEGAAIVAAKHQSYYETIALLSVLDSPAIVLKRELLGVPLWGFFTRRHGAMPIDREQGAAALRAMVRTARVAVGQGRAILIFPEGTRVQPGEAPPIKPGVSALYALLDVPAVPLALDTADVWPMRGWPRAGVARFAFGDALPPGMARAPFEAAVNAGINALQAPIRVG